MPLSRAETEAMSHRSLDKDIVEAIDKIING